MVAEAEPSAEEGHFRTTKQYWLFIMLVYTSPLATESL